MKPYSEVGGKQGKVKPTPRSVGSRDSASPRFYDSNRVHAYPIGLAIDLPVEFHSTYPVAQITGTGF